MKHTVSARILAVLLVITMVFAMIPATQAAAPITVTAIEKYGNLDLSITGPEFFDLGYTYGDVVYAVIRGVPYRMPVGSNYSDVDTGEMVCRVTDDRVILAINMGDFATTYGLATKITHEDKTFEWTYNEGVSTPVTVEFQMAEKGGYIDEYAQRQLTRTNNREDYADLTDAQFANFRSVTTSGMGEGKLYRSSSPINPEINRNTYAMTAMEQAGIKTVINLADDAASAASYEGFEGSYYANQNVVYLGLGVDFRAQSFRQGLAEGLRYMAAHEGPYLIHCNEGKDRAGFVSFLLEGLMGASDAELIADYMVTYSNYYGIQPGTQQYDAIANGNIRKTLANALYSPSQEFIDMEGRCEGYMRGLGLSDEEIDAIRVNLGGKAKHPAMPFTDIKQNSFYYNDLKIAYERGWINGVTETTFVPGGTMTRGMMVTILWRAYGAPTGYENKFVDVAPGRYYTQAIAWAADKGIVNGIDKNHFAPNDPITREQVVTVLYRLQGYHVPSDTGVLNKFPDHDKVSRYAVEPMEWAVRAQILNGVRNGDVVTLSPKDYATRAQVVTLVTDCLMR